MPCSVTKQELFLQMEAELLRKGLVYVKLSRFYLILETEFNHVKFPKYCQLGMCFVLSMFC